MYFWAPEIIPPHPALFFYCERGFVSPWRPRERCHQFPEGAGEPSGPAPDKMCNVKTNEIQEKNENTEEKETLAE